MLTGSGTWPDDKGFLGDPAHSATGLVDVGARKFDPATGLFISVDPQLDPTKPQTMTGYTYAADNPVTDSDPTGMVTVDDNGDVVIHPYDGGGGSSCTEYCDGNIPIGRVPKHSAYSDGTYTNNGYVGYGHVTTRKKRSGGFHPLQFLASPLRKAAHFAYHDVLPVAAGVVAFAGCEWLTSPADTAGCIALGAGVYGYVNNAVATNQWNSSDDSKSAIDSMAFGYCVAGETATCGELSVDATMADYATDVHNTGEGGGDSLKTAERGLGYDVAGVGFGHTVDGLSQDALKADEASAAASVRRGPAGGSSAPLSATTEGAAAAAQKAPSAAYRATVKGLVYAANYEFGTITCANPLEPCAE